MNSFETKLILSYQIGQKNIFIKLEKCILIFLNIHLLQELFSKLPKFYINIMRVITTSS